MAEAKTCLKEINSFLAKKRIALIGVSTDNNDFSRVLLREFIKRGYEITPVNPASSFLEDRHCYARVGEITPPVEGVLVMTPPSVTEDVVRDCVDAGIKDVWLYRSVGQGSISPNAVSYCREHEINLIEGYCPMMFFRDAGLIHRIHRGFARLFGHFPREC